MTDQINSRGATCRTEQLRIKLASSGIQGLFSHAFSASDRDNQQRCLLQLCQHKTSVFYNLCQVKFM